MNAIVVSKAALPEEKSAPPFKRSAPKLTARWAPRGNALHEELLAPFWTWFIENPRQRDL